MSDDICVPEEAAKNIIIMQGPVHYPELLLSTTYTENALVVMSESNKINSIIFVVISVYFPIFKFIQNLFILTLLSPNRKEQLKNHHSLQQGTSHHEKYQQNLFIFAEKSQSNYHVELTKSLNTNAGLNV